MDSSAGARLRVLMFPWLGFGHIIPYLELAKRLSNRNFHIYFCSTPVNLDFINKELSEVDNVSIDLVQLHLPSLPQLPPHHHTTKNLPSHLFPTLSRAFEMSSSGFSDIVTNLQPDLLIYDCFQPWSAKFAASQGIPSVHFSVIGAAGLSFFIHGQTRMNYDSFPFPEIHLRGFEQRDESFEARAIEENSADEGYGFLAFQQSCEVLLVKSWRGIEGKYMEYLTTLCKKRIVPTGPLIANPKKGEVADPEIMNWLSGKSQDSTLYISFGSECYLSKKQIGEIAKGLLQIDANFVWIARTPVESGIVVEEALPEGFLDRVRGRGLLVKRWAPQAAILAHPSVGGFMSHCGWSSVTEAVHFVVPVVGLPLKLDQPLWCRLVVDAGVGVEVMRDENGEFDGEGVARAISEVIGEKGGGEGLRSRVRELSKKIEMEEKEAFDEVAEELLRVCAKKPSAV